MPREVYTGLVTVDTLTRPLAVFVKDVHEVSSIFLASF